MFLDFTYAVAVNIHSSLPSVTYEPTLKTYVKLGGKSILFEKLLHATTYEREKKTHTVWQFCVLVCSLFYTYIWINIISLRKLYTKNIWFISSFFFLLFVHHCSLLIVFRLDNIRFAFVPAMLRKKKRSFRECKIKVKW